MGSEKIQVSRLLRTASLFIGINEIVGKMSNKIQEEVGMCCREEMTTELGVNYRE